MPDIPSHTVKCENAWWPVLYAGNEWATLPYTYLIYKQIKLYCATFSVKIITYKEKVRLPEHRFGWNVGMYQDVKI